MSHGVVYTTNIAARDAALPEIRRRIRGADYVCFADPECVWRHTRSDWEVRYAWPVDDCPVRAARYHKCCPHRVLPGYDWWIWVDCNTVLGSSLRLFQEADMTLVQHQARHTLQIEFEVCRRRYRAAPGLLAQQYADYAARLPLDVVIPQTGVCGRRNVGWVCDVNDAWWAEIERYTPRDQLSIQAALRAVTDAPHMLAQLPETAVSFSYAKNVHTEAAYCGYQHRLGSTPLDVIRHQAATRAWYSGVHGSQLPEYRFTADYTEAFQRKLRALRATGFVPQAMLEIGVYEGRGAVAAKTIMPELRSWVGCDPWCGRAPSEHRTRAEWNLRQLSLRTGLDIRIFDREAAGACDELKRADARFDLVYIDGAHTADAVIQDSQNAWALVRPGGVIVWDDIPWTPSPQSSEQPVRRGLETFLASRGLDITQANFDGWQCHLTRLADT